MSPQRPTPLAALLSQHASPGQLLPSGMRQLGGSRPRKQAGDAGDGAWRRPACPRPLVTGWKPQSTPSATRWTHFLWSSQVSV